MERKNPEETSRENFLELHLTGEELSHIPLLRRGGRNPICPKCNSPLAGLKHATGIAWRCRLCGGQSLNFSQFRKLIPGEFANEIWMTAIEQPVAPRRRVPCPECRRDMLAVLIPFQGRGLELDICSRCQRLWLEKQEGNQYRLEPDEAPGPSLPMIPMKGRGLRSALLQKFQRTSLSHGQEAHFQKRKFSCREFIWSLFASPLDDHPDKWEFSWRTVVCILIAIAVAIFLSW